MSTTIRFFKIIYCTFLLIRDRTNSERGKKMDSNSKLERNDVEDMNQILKSVLSVDLHGYLFNRSFFVKLL